MAVRSSVTSILVVDNYDSFVYTIVGYLNQLGARTHVLRNDDPELVALLQREKPFEEYDGVLISPGPGTPQEAGSSIAAIEACAATVTPMLGVCLGHQALGEVFGGTVAHSPELMHGKTSLVAHGDAVLFDGLPTTFTATRYHSLAVLSQTVPAILEVTATTEPHIVMGLSHRELPLHGVQFHPESVLTQGGHRLLANWLAICGDPDAVAASVGLAPLVTG